MVNRSLAIFAILATAGALSAADYPYYPSNNNSSYTPSNSDYNSSPTSLPNNYQSAYSQDGQTALRGGADFRGGDFGTRGVTNIPGSNIRAYNRGYRAGDSYYYGGYYMPEDPIPASQYYYYQPQQYQYQYPSQYQYNQYRYPQQPTGMQYSPYNPV